MGETDLDTWEPSDEWLASLVRRLRGMEPGEPVPPALLSSWRHHLRLGIRRAARAKHDGRESHPADRHVPDPGKITTGEVIAEILASPEGQFWIGVAAAVPRMIAGWKEEERVRLQVGAWHARADRERAARVEIRQMVAYLDSKFDGSERPYQRPAFGVPRHALIAAANACTPARVAVWRGRLSDRDDAPDAICEMLEVGRDAIGGIRDMVLDDPEPGPPRGVWPDPPPPPLPEDTPSVSSVIASGERPAFVPGR